MNHVVSIKRKGRNPVRESAFSHPVCFSGHREKQDDTTISSISNTPRHYRRCLSGSTATQTSKKLNPGTACPAPWWMASKDVNQNALTFVQVEHGESPLKAVSGLMRSQNADTFRGYAEIPSKDLTILKGH